MQMTFSFNVPNYLSNFYNIVQMALSKMALSNFYLKKEQYVSRLLLIKKDFVIKSNYITHFK